MKKIDVDRNKVCTNLGTSVLYPSTPWGYRSLVSVRYYRDR